MGNWEIITGLQLEGFMYLRAIERTLGLFLVRF